MHVKGVRVWSYLNWPNRISLLRLLLVGPFMILLMNQHEVGWARHAALAILLVMAVSDFADGMLARRLNMRTRFGAILDPLADKVLIICSVVLLSMDGSCVPGARLPNWVVVAVVGKDLWVIAGFVVVYLVTDRFRVHPTFAGKVCTLGQLVLVTAVLASPDIDAAAPRAGGLAVDTMCWMVAGMCVLAMASYLRLGVAFVAEGGKPLDEHHAGGKRV